MGFQYRDVSQDEIRRLIRAFSEGGTSLDLMFLNMHDMTIEDCHLGGALLKRSNLTGCRFRNVNFYGANFRSVVASNAIFENCDLRETNFKRARLDGLSLNNCKTEGMFTPQVIT